MKNLFGTQGPPGWLVTGGAASIALLYLIFVFLPMQKAMKASRTQLAEKQKYIAGIEGQYTAVSATDAEVEQTRVFTAQWRQNAPDAQQIDGLPSQVSSQASLSGVRILRLEPLLAKSHGLVVEYPILVSVEGSFESIFKFFKGLEELPQTIWFQDVNLHKTGEMAGTLRCELTLTILGDLAEKSN
jgi:Tfp pilus assembly protein PilO